MTYSRGELQRFDTGIFSKDQFSKAPQSPIKANFEFETKEGEFRVTEPRFSKMTGLHYAYCTNTLTGETRAFTHKEILNAA